MGLCELKGIGETFHILNPKKLGREKIGGRGRGRRGRAGKDARTFGSSSLRSFRRAMGKDDRDL